MVSGNLTQYAAKISASQSLCGNGSFLISMLASKFQRQSPRARFQLVQVQKQQSLDLEFHLTSSSITLFVYKLMIIWIQKKSRRLLLKSRTSWWVLISLMPFFLFVTRLVYRLYCLPFSCIYNIFLFLSLFKYIYTHLGIYEGNKLGKWRYSYSLV